MGAGAARDSLRRPRRDEVELAELLRQLERLGDDALLGRVVSALDEAGEREVLAHGVALRERRADRGEETVCAVCVEVEGVRAWNP